MPASAQSLDVRRSNFELPYIPQLDALRAFAVGGVLVTHFYGLRNLPQELGHVHWGHLGVLLFFVLSGYLISTILLKYRDAAEETRLPKWHYVRLFYVRRALRIFPLYYFVVFAALALGVPPIRDAILWLVTYTANFYITTHWNWLGPMGHFWTLAVEEQFYLVWPWLIVFLPRKWLVPVILACISVAPLYRAYLVGTYPEDVLTGGTYTLTHTAARLDTLGAGALLAIALHAASDRQRLHRVLTRVCLPIAAAACGILQILLVRGISRAAHIVLFDVAAAIVFACVIACATRGIGGPIGRLLQWRPLIYVGRISYGVYVYHNFVPPALASVGIVFNLRSVAFLVFTAVTLAVASLSWHLLERPLNGLKRHLTLERRPSATAIAASSAPI